MPLAKIATSARMGDRAFDAIHAAIMSGEFPGGYRLQPSELAGSLGISPMPVREAIKRLEAIGLVEELPYRGTVVKTLGRDELLNTYAVRKLLEVEATKLGADSVGDEQIAKMEVAFGAMVQALEDGDVADYLDRDEEILTYLYLAADNTVLMETIQVLWQRCRPFKIVGVRGQIDSGERGPLLEHQRSLIDVLKAGDRAAAGSITAESMDAATARVHHALMDQ